MSKIHFLLLSTLFAGASAYGAILQEDIGELKIHDLLLRPNFTLQQPHQGNFSIGESSFALRWELEGKYFGVIRIGPESLVNPSARYSQKVPDTIALVEAFAEYNDVYGRFRFGKIPVEFGIEGRMWERDLIFPRSMLFQKRVTMLRDVGVSYEIGENQWYTGFAVHNGESANDLDGRTWYTAHWGYRNDNFEIGFAGQAGSTTPASTDPDQNGDNKDTLADVDSTKNERWRLLGLYTNLVSKRWDWTLEAYLGELEQQTETRFATGHTDLGYTFTKRFSMHARYDYFNNNTSVAGEAETQISLALVMSNQTHSSNVILVGTKDLVQGGHTPADALMLIWSLSPSGVVRF